MVAAARAAAAARRAAAAEGRRRRDAARAAAAPPSSSAAPVPPASSAPAGAAEAASPSSSASPDAALDDEGAADDDAIEDAELHDDEFDDDGDDALGADASVALDADADEQDELGPPLPQPASPLQLLRDNPPALRGVSLAVVDCVRYLGMEVAADLSLTPYLPPAAKGEAALARWSRFLRDETIPFAFRRLVACAAVLSVARYGAEVLGFRATERRGDGVRVGVFARLNALTARVVAALLNTSGLNAPARAAFGAELRILSHASYARRAATRIVGGAHDSATWLAPLVAAYRRDRVRRAATIDERRADHLALYSHTARLWTPLLFPLRGLRRPDFREVRRIADVAQRARAVGRKEALEGCGRARRHRRRGVPRPRLPAHPHFRPLRRAGRRGPRLGRAHPRAPQRHAHRRAPRPPRARAGHVPRLPRAGARLGRPPPARLPRVRGRARRRAPLRPRARAATALVQGRGAPAPITGANKATLLLGGAVDGRRIPGWTGRGAAGVAVSRAPPGSTSASTAAPPPTAALGPHLPPCQVVGRFLAAIEPKHSELVMALYEQNPGFGDDPAPAAGVEGAAENGTGDRDGDRIGDRNGPRDGDAAAAAEEQQPPPPPLRSDASPPDSAAAAAAGGPGADDADPAPAAGTETTTTTTTSSGGATTTTSSGGTTTTTTTTPGNTTSTTSADEPAAGSDPCDQAAPRRSGRIRGPRIHLQASSASQ